MRTDAGFVSDADPGSAQCDDRLDDRVTRGELASVVGLIDHEGLRLFVIPRRFLDRPGPELPFHNVGGKRAPDEDWIDALQREATEEIGVRLAVRSAEITRQVSTAAELAPVRLLDQPRPYCIYHRTRDVDPEMPEPATRWIVGYEAGLPEGAGPEPQSEIAAVLLLSPRLVRRTARHRIPYDRIAAAGDGSRVIVAPGTAFAWDRVAVPTGLAALPVVR